MSMPFKYVLGAAAAILVAGADLAAAREIEVDEISITGPGAREGRSSFIPWSGVWWPFTDLELSKGWNGTSADFTYDETAKRWNRAQTQKPVNERSPLLKYDEYVRLATGTDPGTALLECTGDEPNDFQHSVYGDKKKQYDDDGVSYSWWGHCNGWCGAAIMVKEPIGPIEARGIKFEVADLKGLLSESYWGVESDFTGRRYNKPKKVVDESRQPGKDLLAALNAGTPRPVAEYIAWYEKGYETTMSAAAKASAKAADFKDELEGFESWFVRTYDEAYKDLPPAVFHRIIETVIGRKRSSLVFDVTANEEVWNHPAFAYSTSFALARSFTEAGTSYKEWTVSTTVWYATDGVSESILGISDFSKSYTYKLVTNATTNRVVMGKGEWTGSSVDNHPDFAWLPVNNPTGTDYGENYKLLYGKILEILPVAHKQTEARAIDVAVNGTAASTRRGNDRTTTWDEPIAASGDVALTVAVASGRAVAKVKYFQQTVDGSSDITANRAALASLGEGTTAPGFGATARFTSNGKKFVLAYAYDASNRLLGVDEVAIQYSTSGGGGTTPTTDDAFEQNDSQAAAASIAAGSYPNLQCGDEDWFKVTLAATGGVTFKIDFANSEGDLDMVLSGPSGQVAKSDTTANTESVSGTNLPAGTYFARIFGYNGAKAKYTLNVTVTGGTGPVPSNDDSYEPNNAKAQAAALAAGSFPGLKCNDDDWFKVTLAQAGSLTVKIDFANATGDLDMIVENASGTEVGRSETTADSEQVAKTGLAAGTYFVHVFGYNGAKAPYSATVTVTTSGTTPTTRTGTVTAGALNVRSGAATTYPIVRTIYSGQVVTILGESGSWYKITWQGAPAGNLYASKSYIRVNP